MNLNFKSPFFVIVGFALIGFIVFGFLQLNIGTFSNSDFTLNNTELVNGHIQLSRIMHNVVHNNPSFGDVSAITLKPVFTVVNGNWGPPSNALLLYAGPNTLAWYCGAFAGFGVSSISNANLVDATSLVFVTPDLNDESISKWAGDYHVSGVSSINYVSVTCAEPTGYLQTSGTIVQTNPVFINQSCTTLSLSYNKSLNSQTLIPILDVDGVDYGLVNNQLQGKFKAGTSILVKFVFSGDGVLSPDLKDNVVLRGFNSSTSSVSSLSTVAVQQKQSPIVSLNSSSVSQGFVSNLNFNLGVLFVSPLFWVVVLFLVVYLVLKRFV